MKIAVLPGDGIGTEIMREAVKVLNGLGESFEFEEAPIGGAGYDASGDPLPDATLALAKKADAILLGATGDWKYDKLDRKLRPEQGMLRLRKELHFFANLRPAFLYDDLIGASPGYATGRPLTAAGRSMAANRSPGRLTTNSAMSLVRLRTPSTVTIESMPPPNGTSGRMPPAAAWCGSVPGASVSGPSMRRSLRSRPLR